MDYLDPNDYWRQAQYDYYKDMSEEERAKAGCLQGAAFFVMLIVGLMLCALLGSCTTTRYVPVTETHNVYHHTTDTILKTDSVIDRQTTVIREVDSATMARFGIQLQSMQRAWLIESDRMQREISRLREATHDTIHEHDSVPVPYPVEKVVEVEKHLTLWQRVLIWTGGVVIAMLAIVAGVWLWRLKRW